MLLRPLLYHMKWCGIMWLLSTLRKVVCLSIHGLFSDNNFCRCERNFFKLCIVDKYNKTKIRFKFHCERMYCTNAVAILSCIISWIGVIFLWVLKNCEKNVLESENVIFSSFVLNELVIILGIWKGDFFFLIHWSNLFLECWKRRWKLVLLRLWSLDKHLNLS